jgi:hypothetical protein
MFGGTGDVAFFGDVGPEVEHFGAEHVFGVDDGLVEGDSDGGVATADVGAELVGASGDGYRAKVVVELGECEEVEDGATVMVSADEDAG